MNHRVTILTVLSLGLGSAQAASVTLNSAVTAALNNNADVKTAQANLDKAAAASKAAQADPSTLVTARLTTSNALAASQAGLRDAKLSTLQSTVTAYTNLLEAQENVELQTLQVQNDTKSVQVAQTKRSIGNATNLDVQNAQNALSASQQTLADARAQVNLVSAKLGTLTGMGSGLKAAGITSVPKLTVTLGSLQGGIGTLNSLVNASGDVSEAQLGVKLANNDFTPARTLQDAQTALANAQRTFNSTQKSALQTLASTYQTAQNTYELLRVAQSREAAAQKQYNQDALRLKSGTISPVELQSSQLILKKAQFARLQAQDNVLTALAALSVASGKNLTGIY